MASGSSQNATVEEILASIRQAIADDDARRIGHDAPEHGEPMSDRPSANGHHLSTGDDHTDVMERLVVADAEADAAADAGLAIEDEDDDTGPVPDVIEQAISEAVDGVRAELEAERASFVGRMSSGRGAPRTSRPLSGSRRQVAIPRPTLLSQGPDAQVSASFERLANAMVSGDEPKLDMAVEEVLRPMLKTWLDNNLPQMVERLVREEIERVTRGRR